LVLYNYIDSCRDTVFNFWAQYISKQLSQVTNSIGYALTEALEELVDKMCALCCDSTSFFQYNYRLKLILPFFGKTMRMMPLQIEVMNSVKGIIKQIELWEVVA